MANRYVLIIGQSNAKGFGEANGPALAYGSHCYIWDANTSANIQNFSDPIGQYNKSGDADYDASPGGSWVPSFANALLAVPAYASDNFYFVCAAKGGSTVANWAVAGTLYNLSLTKLAAAGCTLATDEVYVVIHQGEANAGVGEEGFLSSWNTIIAGYAGAITNVKFLICQTGKTGAGIAAQRRAQKRMDNGTTKFLAASCYDLTMQDPGVSSHYTQAGYNKLGQRLAATMLHILDSTTYPTYRGPQLSTVTYANYEEKKRVLLTFDKNITGALVANENVIFKDCLENIITPASVSVSGAVLTATFSTAISGYPIVEIGNEAYPTQGTALTGTDSNNLPVEFNNVHGSYGGAATPRTRVYSERGGTDVSGNSKDTYITPGAASASVHRSFEATDPIYVGASSVYKYGLFRWDITDIHADEVIKQALFEVVTKTAPAADLTIREYLLKTQYGASQTADGANENPATAGQATYNHSKDYNGGAGEVNWSAGAYSSADRNLNYGGEYTVTGGEAALTAHSVDVTSIIQAWQSNRSNYAGIVQEIWNPTGYDYQLYSKEQAGTARRPKLTITYVRPVFITSITASGRTVTIAGKGFKPASTDATVTINGISYTPASCTNTEIVVNNVLPANGVTAVVTNSDGETDSGTVSVQALAGSTYRLTFYSGASDNVVWVKFGAGEYQQVTTIPVPAEPDTELTYDYTIPTTGPNGTCQLKVTSGAWTTEWDEFTIYDSATVVNITSITATGRTVTIAGTGFKPDATNATVTINGNSYTPASCSNTEIVINNVEVGQAMAVVVTNSDSQNDSGTVTVVAPASANRSVGINVGIGL